MATSAKPFNITLSDIQFLLNQVRFGTIKIVGYDANGNAIYGYTDAGGTTHQLGALGTFDPLSVIDPVTNQSIYYSALDASGLRNIDGVFNNLTSSATSTWGAANDPFLRLVHADYSHYLKQNVDPNANTGLPIVADPSHPFASALDTSNGQHNFHTTPVVAAPDYSNPFASVVDYTPRMISQTVTSSSGAGNSAHVSAMDYAILTQGLAAETVTIDAIKVDASGHVVIDPNTLAPVTEQVQETFIRNVNSVALDPSTSGWMTLFGQFFDHGLDFIDKPGNGPKITIALATDDPLYRAPETNGPGDRGVTSITIARATPDAGTGTGGVEAQYTNHDSPYIDQNQTYGANEQITSLLRGWVSTDGGATFHAGAELLDGSQTVAYHSQYFNDAGSDAGGNLTKRTLPTLDELRAAMNATGRGGANGLTWEDISNYRLRDAQGHVLDTDPASGLQTKGSGQAIILDMNPRVDAGHITQQAVDALNAAAGTNFTINTKLGDVDCERLA